MLLFWCCAHSTTQVPLPCYVHSGHDQGFYLATSVIGKWCLLTNSLSFSSFSLSFRLHRWPFVQMNNARPLLIERRRTVLGRLGQRYGGCADSRREGFQQDGGLLLVLLSLPLQGAGQPALHRLLHLQGCRRLC